MIKFQSHTSPYLVFSCIGEGLLVAGACLVVSLATGGSLDVGPYHCLFFL